MLRFAVSGWIPLRTTNVHMALQDIAETDRLGIFAAAAPVGRGPFAVLPGLPGVMAALSAALGLILVIFILLRRRGASRRPAGVSSTSGP